jgi:hypothetical protein
MLYKTVYGYLDFINKMDVKYDSEIQEKELYNMIITIMEASILKSLKKYWEMFPNTNFDYKNLDFP